MSSLFGPGGELLFWGRGGGEGGGDAGLVKARILLGAGISANWSGKSAVRGQVGYG
jgi:hypothetical protein